MGSLAGDFDMAQEYRAETLAFVRNRLGLDNSKILNVSSNEVINSFDFIGDALRESCSKGMSMPPFPPRAYTTHL